MSRSDHRRAGASFRPRLESLEERLAPAVSVTYEVTSNWGSGFQGQVRMVNPDPTNVPDWRLEFDFAGSISSIWDGRILTQSGNHFTIANAGWNSTLSANGGSVSFGFVASPGGVTAPTGYRLNGVPLGSGGGPTLPTLSLDDLSVGESAGQAQFTVRLSQASTTPVTVRYATSNGSAQAGSDYTAASGTLTFAPGQTTQTFTVPILSDTTDEPNETFQLTLSNPTGATLSRSQATGTILDDDPPPASSGDFQYRVVNSWGTGFTGEITARNGTGAVLNDWKLEFDFSGQISSIWNANILSHTGNRYVITHAGWNSTVPVGATVTFGFVASPAGVAAPSNFRWGGTGGGGGATNRTPVAVNDSASTRPAQSVAVSVLANDSDPDGDALSVLSVATPAHGVVVINGDGTVSYTPTAGYTGNDSFAYTISDGRGGTAQGLVNLTVADQTWPVQFYAPYVDTTLWPTYDFLSVARNQGLRYFTLAFIVADPSGRPAWGGYSEYAVGSNGTFETNIKTQIAGVRALGGDVMVSFGGASNRELAEVITNVTTLKNAYRQVIDAYQLTRVDFDIEGAATADRVSVDRRSQALAALQTELRAAGRELEIWYTLPVLPTGLTNDGVYVLQSARRYGVDIGGVNIMTMDYGDSAAPNPQGRMGDYAIQAAQSLHAQLTTLYGTTKTSAQLWDMVGLTPMIGLNDVTTEVFDQQEAREVLAFAEQVGIGRISIWSLNRDRQNAAGAIGYVDLHSSSILQSPFEFSLLFDALTRS